MLTVNKFIFKEMIPPFFIGLFFFAFVFTMTSILQFTQYIVNYDISVWIFILMLIFSLPSYLIFVVPMSVMISVLFTFLRMSNDNEIVALKAGGYSIFRLLPPVMLFCFFGFLFTVVLTVYGLPWGSSSLKSLTTSVAVSNPKIGFKERTFIDSFEGFVLHFDKMDFKRDQMEGIYIEDRRSEDAVTIVVAPTGKIVKGLNETTFYLRLLNGTINRASLEKRSVHSISFDTYDLRLEINKPDTSGKHLKRAGEMYLDELRRYINEATVKDKRYTRALMEFYRKLSIPVACFALGFLAMPLGIQIKSVKKSSGVGFALVFFLLYYILLSIGWGFSGSGYYPPAVGMWVPDIVIGAIGCYFFFRVANDRPLEILFSIKTLANRIITKILPGNHGNKNS